MPSPSLKKLGKRPALGGMDGLEIRETTTLSQSPGVTPVHQKRVLPSRSRRGGPGIGNCSVDLLIIDTERRARDARPVIPPTQAFFLTTYSKGVPPPPESSVPDGEAASSYFDKPEVKAAYLAARAIQVPEFSPLPDDAVGGRLRARAEEEGPETSDEAYLMRHRKYETFEKRQRRREKEKLVHERYKLKERIEQLKGMDATAFGVGGEARRKDMLDVAEDLEMRYAVLLPPEPRRNMKKDDNKKKIDGTRAGVTTEEDADARTEEEVDNITIAEHIPPASTGTRPTKMRKQSVRPEPESPVMTRMPAVSVVLATDSPQDMHDTLATQGLRISNRVRDSTGRFVLISKSAEEVSIPGSPPITPDPLSVSAPPKPEAPPPRKRQRVEKRTHTPEANTVQTSVLLQIAARKAAQPQARQTSRTTLAFGFRVPPEVEEAMYFALPGWLATEEELEHLHEVRARSATRTASPNLSGHVLNGMNISKHEETKEPQVLADVEMREDAAKEIEVAEAILPVGGPLNGKGRDTTGTLGLPTSSVREETEMEDVVMEIK